MTLRYDASVPALVRGIAEHFGKEVLEQAVIVRDAGGRLSAILAQRVPSEHLQRAASELNNLLGNYARPDRILGDIDNVGSGRLLAEAKGIFPLNIEGYSVRVIDRRIVGADWLRPPAPSSIGIPRFVFASLKGGVGRSTALCVLAAHLSRRGRRVLAIDFDLEAPGIGSMLLNEKELPQFGTLDYFVENGLSGVDDSFMANLSGDSYLGSEGARVTVVPAVGRSTLDHPANALGKIARAYIENLKDDGTSSGLSEKLTEMISWFEATGAYDVILVDARAGLHETTAAAILSLGGDTLLFGADQLQTFQGYRLLMAHLAQFPINADDDWRNRLCFVHAKASDNSEKQAQASERFMELYDAVVPKLPEIDQPIESLTAEDFKLEWADATNDIEEDQVFSPPSVLRILDDSRYRDFNPIAEGSLLVSDTYSATFKSLLDYVDGIMDDIMMTSV